jgi:hypothetical protein
MEIRKPVFHCRRYQTEERLWIQADPEDKRIKGSNVLSRQLISFSWHSIIVTGQEATGT